MKFKRVISGLLSLAMVATSVFTGDMTAAKAAEMPAPVASYSFEDGLGEATAMTTGYAAYDGEVEYTTGRTGAETDKAVALNGKHGIVLPEENLGTSYTVSLWVNLKEDVNNFAPLLALGNDGIPKWMTIAGAWEDPENAADNEQYIIWGTDIAAADEMHFEIPKNTWTMLTIAQTGTDVTLYKNGEEAGTMTAPYEILNGEGQGIHIGMNQWDQMFPGYVDDVLVYNAELTAEQVKGLFDGKTAEEVLTEEGFTASEELTMYVGDSKAVEVKLPSRVSASDVTVTYTSKDAAVATVDEAGLVKGVAVGETVVETTVTAGEYTATKETAVKVEKNEIAEIENVEVLAHFDFDADAVDGVLTGTNAKATVSGATINKDDKVSGEGALSLNGSSFIEVKNAEDGTLISGQEELTISYYSKSTAAPGWAYFINKDSNSPTGGAEYYLGILDRPSNAGGILVERYSNGRVNTGNTGSRTADWTKIDVVYGKDYTTLYVNGVEASTQPAITSIEDSIGTESVFYIGKATWGGGEYFTGLLDDYTVYAGALTATQVRYLYDGKTPEEVFETEVTVTPEMTMLAETTKSIDVKIPTLASGAKVTFESENPNIATVDAEGKVTAVKVGTTKIITTATYKGIVVTKETTIMVDGGEGINREVVAEYDLTQIVNGKLVDVSGRGNDATVQGEAGISFVEENGQNVMVMASNDSWVELPTSIMDALSNQEKFTIETKFAKSSACGNNAWLFCLGSKVKSTGTNYLFLSPNFESKTLRAGIKNSGTEKLFATSIQPKVDEWYTVNMVFDEGTVKLYWNGVLVNGDKGDKLDSGYSIMNDVVNPGTENGILGYIGKSCWAPDKNYQGKVASFKIYDKAMTDEEIQTSNPEWQANLNKQLNDTVSLANVLGKNEAADNIRYNLTFPATVNEVAVTWTSDKPEVISEAGIVTNGAEDTTVTVTASIKSGVLTAEKTFTFTVKAADRTALDDIVKEANALLTNEYLSEASKAAIAKQVAKAEAATSQSSIDKLVNKIKEAMEDAEYIGIYADPFTAIDESKIAYTVELNAGQTANMYTVPEEIKDMVTVAYASDNTAVATVSETGVITAVKDGYARVTLTVTAKADGFAMEYQTLVKVGADLGSFAVSAPVTSLLKAGTTQLAITAPSNATLSFRAKGSVAVTNTGKVTGKKAGNGTVYVTAIVDGKKVTKKVAFTVADITGKATVKVKKTTTLKVEGISGAVTWSVNKPKLATIDKNGKLKAKKKGKVVVTAKVGNVTLTKTITIKKK